MNVDLDDAQGQMVVLALAHLAVERPGWKIYLEETAQSIGGGDLFVKFYQYRSDGQPEVPAPVIPRQPTAKQLEDAAIKLMGYHEYACGDGHRAFSIKEAFAAGYTAGFNDVQLAPSPEEKT